MRNVYRVLAFVVAASVVVQAAAIAFGVFGLLAWVEGGGTLDKAAMESESVTFTGLSGIIVHAIAGTMVIPLLVLLFLISSFFAKVPGGVRWALYTVLATLVQVALGIFAHGVPFLGILHGACALVLFGVAMMAGMRVKSATRTAELTDTQSTAPVATA